MVGILQSMDPLNDFLNVITGFLESLLDLVQSFFNLIIGFLQGILNLFQ